MDETCNSGEGVLHGEGDSDGIRGGDGLGVVVGAGKVVIFSAVEFDLVGGDCIDGGGIGGDNDFLEVEGGGEKEEESKEEVMHESFHVIQVCIVTLY